jgi:hypothetical protein
LRSRAGFLEADGAAAWARDAVAERLDDGDGRLCGRPGERLAGTAG